MNKTLHLSIALPLLAGWLLSLSSTMTQKTKETAFHPPSGSAVISCIEFMYAPPDKIIDCDESPRFDLPMAVDTCCHHPAITMTKKDSVAYGPCEVRYIRKWVATSPCGGKATYIQTILSTDTTRPVLVFHNPLLANLSDGDTIFASCDDPLQFQSTDISTTDNCDPDPSVTKSEEVTDANCDDAGYTTLIKCQWTALDSCFNEATFTIFIGLIDTLPPAIQCPPDKVLNCPGHADPSITGYPWVSDNCDTLPSISFVDDTIRQACLFTIYRTWQATDECGNLGSCTQVISFEDTEDPSIACPDDITIACDQAADPSLTGHAIAVDNCDQDLLITYRDDTTAIQACGYLIRRTWTASDDCGNEASCLQEITVTDDETPQINCPADTVLECGIHADISNLPPATASDNCDPDVRIIYEDDTLSTDPCHFIIARTWTAEDNCGLQSMCTQIITISDTTPPQIVCPADVRIECDQTADPSLTGYAIGTDHCDSDLQFTFSDDTTEVIPGCIYLIARTWIALDDCGNTASCTQLITIEDTTPPVVVPIDPDLQQYANGDTIVLECDDLPVWNINSVSVTDHCDPDPHVEFIENIVQGDCENDGFLSFMECAWIATDRCGNSSSFVIFIKIVDSTPPQIDCPDDSTISCLIGTDPSATGVPTGTDNCSNTVDFEYADSILSHANCTLQIARTWTATDKCGNQSDCIQIISVIDTIGLVLITGATDLTVECDGMGNISELQSWLDDHGGMEVLDICSNGALIWTNNFSGLTDDCGQTGTAVVTFTATDACGNTVSSAATFSIVDSTPPAVTQEAADVTYACDVPDLPMLLQNWLDAQGGATAEDPCSGVSWSHDFNGFPGGCNGSGTVLVTFTATDDCGHSTHTTASFTIVDNEAPEITKEAEDRQANCNPDEDYPELVNWLMQHGYAEATDHCGPVNWSNDFPGILIDSCGHTKSYTVTFTASDDCGNSTATTATFSIIDTMPPDILTEAGDLTLECDLQANQQPDLQSWLDANAGAVALDHCSAVTWTHDFTALLPDCGHTGHATVTFTATDACGNSARTTATFRIVDTTPPVFDHVPTDSTLSCEASFPTDDIVVFDACDSQLDIELIETLTPGNCASEYSLTKTWIATDDCGNSIAASQTLTIVDETAPQIMGVPTDETIRCTDQVPAPAQVIVTDNCDSNPDLDFSEMTVGSACQRRIIRIWTATDDCGNSDSAQQTITVIDDVAPHISCPPDTTIECDASADPAFTGYASAADECSGITLLTWQDDTLVIDTCSYRIERNWTAADSCGNVASCIQNITVTDTQAPVLTPVDTLLIGLMSGDTISMECDDLILLGLSAVAVSDNCDSHPDYEMLENVFSQDCLTAGYKALMECIWKATDNCGNTASLVIYVKVFDHTPPVIVCPPDTTAQCEADGDYGLAVATDNCTDPVDVEYSDHSTYVGLCHYLVERTWIATDACGLKDTCVQQIDVIDTESPVIIPIHPFVLGADSGDTLYTNCGQVSYMDEHSVVVTDNCDPVPKVKFTERLLSTSCDTNQVKYVMECGWTAHDSCDNLSYFYVIVFVVDNLPPILHDVPDDETVECDQIPAPAPVWAEDFCTEATVSLEEREVLTGPNQKQIIRTWTAVDECFNTAVDSQIITAVNCPTALPRILHLRAQPSGEYSVALTWNVTALAFNHYFFIERSVDGVHFGNVGVLRGTVASGGYSTYHFIDREAHAGNNYYRVQLYLSPQYQLYSKVENVTFQQEQVYLVYPNPTSDWFYVEFLQSFDENASFEISDQYGKVLRVGEIPASTKLWPVHIDQELNGMYFLKIHMAGRIPYVKKILKTD